LPRAPADASLAGVQPIPLITVADVAASSRWYQRALGVTSAHGGDEYDQLASDGVVVLQLHHWDAHEHALLGSEQEPSRGNGVALWFELTEFDAAVARLREAGADIADGPLVNPLAQHREVWVRDPDGYVIVLSTPYGDVG
jgi:catechol 2,3-dioxygenase-like lactoylglutathione lyase family enzyme